MRQRWLLLVFIILATFYIYTFTAVDSCLRDKPFCFGLDKTQIGNEQKSPFRYRILEPALRQMAVPDGNQDATVLAVTIMQGCLIAAVLPLLYMWFCRWMTLDDALLHVFIFAAVMMLAFHLWYLILSTSIEVLCVVLTLLFINKRWGWIAPIVVIAAFNRETALFLVALYGVWAWSDRQRRWGSLILLGLYVGITAGIHIIRGPADHMLGLFGTLQYNLGDLATGGIPTLLVLLPIVILIGIGLKYCPPQLRGLTAVSGIYLVAVIIGGAWGESLRLVLPALPILLLLLAKPKLTPIFHN